ncbi:hypothetical protein [Microlunatus speluncae]|uniref:hypothetical protein n=1 Tax=Microlunatus speluncae TaxID=2594267 RepID=UPI001376103A|nr:hypothetical protein [Microlunatus speluncae]
MGRSQRAQGPADGPRWRRWLGWLMAGLAAGLLIGFAAGLTRPRATASLSVGDSP